MQIIRKYFPNLSAKQIWQFSELLNLYEYWNAQINVISRLDISSLYSKHVLHSLAITEVLHFEKDTKVLDIGTGGGFPGIPLAIIFPESDFLLVDSVGKKIKVVNEVKVLKEMDFNLEYFKNYKLSLKIKDNVLSAYLENKLVLEYEDKNNLLDSGAMGLIVEDGTLVTDEIVVG